MRVPVVAVAIPLVQLTDSRNRRGHGDGRRNNRHRLCRMIPAIMLATTVRSRATNRNWPAMNAAGLRRSILAVEGNAIKLHAVVNEAIAQFFGDYFLQGFQLGIDKFDNLASFNIN